MNRRLRTLAALILVLAVAGLLLPSPRLLPAHIWLVAGQEERALSALTGQQSREAVFLRANLLAQLGRYYEGFAAFNELPEDSMERLSLTKQEVAVLARYSRYFWSQGLFARAADLGDAAIKAGWRIDWPHYPACKALTVMGYWDGYVNLASPESTLVRVAALAQTLRQSLGWEFDGAGDPQSLIVFLTAKASELEAVFSSLHPSLQDGARDLLKSVQVYELAVQAHSNTEGWVQRLLSAPEDVFSQFLTSPGVAYLTHQQWQEILAVREGSYVDAAYDYWAFIQDKEQQSQRYGWKKQWESGTGKSCIWSPGGDYLAVISEYSVTFLSREGQVIHQYSQAGIDSIIWQPGGTGVLLLPWGNNSPQYLSSIGEPLVSIIPQLETEEVDGRGHYIIVNWLNQDSLLVINPRNDKNYRYSLGDNSLTPFLGWQDFRHLSNQGLWVGMSSQGCWLGEFGNIVLPRLTICNYSFLWSPGGDACLARDSLPLAAPRWWLLDRQGSKELRLPPLASPMGWLAEDLLLLSQIGNDWISPRLLAYDLNSGESTPLDRPWSGPYSGNLKLSGRGQIALFNLESSIFVIYQLERLED